MNTRGARAVGLLGLTALACARLGTPAGGPQDQRPPVVIQAEPAPRAIVADPSTRVRFRFSERISERPARGTLDDAVVVSPATGAVRVDHGRETLDVAVEGGFRPGLVYRVTVLPVIEDLFGNEMTDPFELVFSTGAELTENAIAGQVLDRINGEPVPDAVVLLHPTAPVPDTLVHLARSDDEGLFFFRYVPEGRYSMVAFQDRNRDLVTDPSEPNGRRGVLITPEDTLIVDVAVLEPDTSAAELLRVEVEDSTTLRLIFSDYLDPESEGRVSAGLVEPDGGAAPAVTRMLHPVAWDALRDSIAAAADSAAPADAPASRVPGPGQTVSVPGQERGGLPAGVPLPRRELIAVLAGPLEIDRTYEVTTTTVVNINGVLLGGGQASVMRRPAPIPAVDSTVVSDEEPGTGVLPPDTISLAPDTVTLPPDLPPPSPDTVVAPPDSVGTPRG